MEWKSEGEKDDESGDDKDDVRYYEMRGM